MEISIITAKILYPQYFIVLSTNPAPASFIPLSVVRKLSKTISIEHINMYPHNPTAISLILLYNVFIAKFCLNVSLSIPLKYLLNTIT